MWYENNIHVRQLSRKISRFQGKETSLNTYFNIVSVTCVWGALYMPYAIKLGGWVSLLYAAVVGFMALYNSHIMIVCLYSLPGVKLKNLPDIGERAFGKIGRLFISILYFGSSLSCSMLYMHIFQHACEDLLLFFGMKSNKRLISSITPIISYFPYLFFMNIKKLFRFGYGI